MIDKITLGASRQLDETCQAFLDNAPEIFIIMDKLRKAKLRLGMSIELAREVIHEVIENIEMDDGVKEQLREAFDEELCLIMNDG